MSTLSSLSAKYEYSSNIPIVWIHIQTHGSPALQLYLFLNMKDIPSMQLIKGHQQMNNSFSFLSYRHGQGGYVCVFPWNSGADLDQGVDLGFFFTFFYIVRWSIFQHFPWFLREWFKDLDENIFRHLYGTDIYEFVQFGADPNKSLDLLIFTVVS